MSSARFRIAARLVAVAALAGLTAGCFQPMYAEHADGTPGLRDKLAGIELPPVDKPNASPEARIGVGIRNALAFKTTFARTSYDIPGSYQRFSRQRAFRDAEDRAAEQIAENIKTRLAAYFTAGT